MTSIDTLLMQHKPMGWEIPHSPHMPDYAPTFPNNLPFGKPKEGDWYKELNIPRSKFLVGGFIIPKNGHPNTIIIPLYKFPNGGDLHENVRYDRYRNEYQNHTTVRFPEKKVIR